MIRFSFSKKNMFGKKFGSLKVLIGIIAAILLLPLTTLAVNDVTGVQAEAANAGVNLSWNAVTGAKSYRIYLGTEPVVSDATYNLPTITTPDNKTDYSVTGLTNGITYYFSVTAVGSDNSESQNYSDPEVSATPQSSAGTNQQAVLKLMTTTAPNNETIELKFNQAVVLPTNAATAFKVTYNFNNSPLTVSKAALKANSNESTIVLTTLPQEPGGEYTIELPTTLKAKAGASLPQSDFTAQFLGSETLPGAVAQTTDEPTATSENESATLKIVSVTPEADGKSITIKFSEPVKLPTATTSQPFAILNNSNPNEMLQITKFELQTGDPTTVILTTDGQKATAYSLVVSNLTDNAGKLIAASASTATFMGVSGGDETPPENVTNLQAMLTDTVKLLVNLSWTQSLNKAGDLAEYVLYVSTDGGQNYTKLRSIAKDADPLLVLSELAANTTSTLKLTSVDTNGNESDGAIVAISLPETGPGLAFLAFGSLFGGRYLSRRKKK